VIVHFVGIGGIDNLFKLSFHKVIGLMISLNH